MFKEIGLNIAIAGVVIGVAIIFGFINYSFFAPKINEVQTKVFKESQAYNDGMRNDFQDLQLQYLAVDTEPKRQVIRAVILQRFANYEVSKLPYEQQKFYEEIK